MVMRAAVIGLAVVLCASTAFGADAGLGLPTGPCGTKPPAKDQRRKGGEGVPPLPLPATPQRRTEKKRPPSPPPLIAKIQYGAKKRIEANGQTVEYWDWDKDPGDVEILLKTANGQLGVNYTSRKGPLSAFPADAAQYPIFLYSGSEDFTLSDAEVERLREFVRAGGTIWGDTVYGDPDFFQAFVREMSKVLPDRRFHRLPAEHPLLNSFHPIKEVVYTRPVPDAPNGEPMLYGMDLGCRTAILVSRYGLCCGWDGHIREGAFNLHPNDARNLGVNMIAYALGTHEVAMSQSVAKVYHEENQQARGDFVFAQARVGENWDCQANGIANLLKTVATCTSAEIKFDRKIVDLASEDSLNYPFLYVTGHNDFVLSDAEVRGLKAYLSAGGFLLAGPCCGSREFDAAFRREIGRVLTGHELQPLAEDHPVYTILQPIRELRYNAFAAATETSLPRLPLEGITLGGRTPLIYCPFGLGGWRGFDHPYGRDVAADDAMKLGVNVVLYSLTH